jgi:hypothetical protein
MPAALGHYDPHPPYPNQAYVVGKKVKLGLNRPSVPNWEVVVERGLPWFNGGGVASNARGVNVAAIAYDWFTDDIAWLGLPDARLDEESFTAVRNATDGFRISPVINEQGEFRSFLGQLAEYADCFPYLKNGNIIALGQWEHGDIDVASLPVVDDSDLEEEPDLTPATYDDCVTSVTVTYRDREHYYNEQNSEPATNPHLLKIIGEPREVTLRRLWITDGATANQYAVEYAAMHSKPRVSGRIRIKRERAKAKGLQVPGKLFNLNSATLGLSITMRSQQVDWPGDREAFASVDCENERAIWPRLYVPPAAPTPGNFQVQAIEIVNRRILELPIGLRSAPAVNEIFALAQRPSPDVVGFNLHVSVHGDIYDPLRSQQRFAVYGRVVNAAYPAATAVIDNSLGLQVELFGVDNIGSQSDTQRDDNTVLVIFGNEIASLGQVVALGGGKYRYHLARGRYGTGQFTHPIGEEVWIIPRSSIEPSANHGFTPGALRYFKLQPYTAAHQLELSAVAAVPYTFAAWIPFAVAGLEIDGQENEYSYTGRNPVLNWRLVTNGLPPSLDVDPATVRPSEESFIEYHVRIREDSDGEGLIYDRGISGPPWTFAYERNALSPGGPHRSWLGEVAILYRARDGSTALTPFASIPPNNPPPPKLVAIDVFAVGGSVHIRIRDQVTDVDAQPPRFIVHRSHTSGFKPGGTVPGEGNCVYVGTDTEIILQQLPGTWYFRVAAIDSFGPNELNYSDELRLAANGLSNYIEDASLLGSISPSSTEHTGPLSVSMVALTGSTPRLTQDESAVQPDSPRWPGALNAWTPLTVNASRMVTTLTVRWFLGNRMSPEVRATYRRTDVPGGGGGGGGGQTCGNVLLGSIVSGQQGFSAVTFPVDCATPGATIEYGFGSAAPGANVTVPLGEIYYFYATAPGFADGPIRTFNNEPAGPPL